MKDFHFKLGTLLSAKKFRGKKSRVQEAFRTCKVRQIVVKAQQNLVEKEVGINVLRKAGLI